MLLCLLEVGPQYLVEDSFVSGLARVMALTGEMSFINRSDTGLRGQAYFTL